MEAFFDDATVRHLLVETLVSQVLSFEGQPQEQAVLTHVAMQTGQGGHCLVARPLHPGTERGGILITPGLVPLRV